MFVKPNSDYGGDGRGVTIGQAEKIGVMAWFYGNTTIKTFDELKYFNNGGSTERNGFMNCTKLESVILPNKLITISTNTFRNCSKLKIDEIPNSVTFVGDYSFISCGFDRVKVPDVPPTLRTPAFDAKVTFVCKTEQIRQAYINASGWSSYGASRYVVE